MSRAESIEFGRDAARWAIARNRVAEPEELAGRVRVGHLTADFVEGYEAQVAEARAAAVEIVHVPEVVA